MKIKSFFALLTAIGVILLFIFGCQKNLPEESTLTLKSASLNAGLPTLTTTTASSITKNSFKSGGKITNSGSSTITARGICWGITQNPTIASSKTSDGTGTGSFTSSVTGLQSGTTYYIRAYATNSKGTAYGNQVTAKTLVVLPTLTTTAISLITASTATSGGNITGDGGGAISARGVCWGTAQNPTISKIKTLNGTGTGSFTSSLTGLSATTTYYLRAYATNSAGTAYGNQLTFKTTLVPAYVPLVGLLGWWPFNGNANDESGNGNNGTVNGATLTADRLGKSKSAYDFNSTFTTDKITTSCIGIQGNRARSISFWYNLTYSSMINSGVMVGYGENGVCGGGWSCSMANNLPFMDISTSWAQYSYISNLNNWYFYCVTYDPSNGTNVLAPKIYINGGLQTTVTATNATECSINTGNWNTLTFGGYSNPIQYFRGKIDDIGIWNRALTQQEVTNLFNGK